MNKPAILVFAYHDVGYECLDLLIQNDEYIVAVITHRDDPNEERWFRSVAALAKKYDIPVYTPETVNTPEWIEKIRSWEPDLIFSFYYRNMIAQEILDLPKLGAFNMHGSLLPKYRGRAPMNWAVLHGEKQTGVTLHHMVKSPDAGDIVDQEAVSILAEDTTQDVFKKAVKAARLVLERQLDGLYQGTAPRKKQDETQASYFSGRKPEDGKIDWTQKAEAIYNLVRAVTHPYPGAFTDLNGKKLLVWWAKPIAGTVGTPGQVISVDPLVVATGSGNLELVNAEWEDDDEPELAIGQVLGA